MKSKTSKGGSAQGAESSKLPSVDDLPSIEQIEKNLVRDLKAAMGAVNAIYSDPDLCKHVATWIHGRSVNEINRLNAEASLPDGEFKGKRL